MGCSKDSVTVGNIETKDEETPARLQVGLIMDCVAPLIGRS